MYLCLTDRRVLVEQRNCRDPGDRLWYGPRVFRFEDLDVFDSQGRRFKPDGQLALTACLSDTEAMSGVGSGR